MDDSVQNTIEFWPTPDELVKKSSPIRSYFKKLKHILSEHKLYFRGMVFAFFISAIIGYIASYYNPELLTPIFEHFESLGNGTPFENVVMIFKNNAFISCLLILTGFFAGIIPLLVILSNGFVVGAVFEYIVKDHGIAFFLIGTVPHGIIEIPIILLSGAVGFRFGVRTILFFFQRVSQDDFIKDILNLLWILILFIIPMLLIAAFIECYVTAALLEMWF